MINLRIFLSALAAIAMAPVANANANTSPLPQDFDVRHKTCLEQISVDAELAFEEAMIWRGDGGGRRARHCEAMALFALGHPTEAAHRLDQLAASSYGGSDDMRVDYYAEAANFWLIANEPEQAYNSATAGLDLDREDADVRIARARAYALLGRFDYAETDLTSVLVFEPNHAGALRYRADARFEQGKLQAAKSDIESALVSDPSSVETALLRGKIIEAIRTAPPISTLTDTGTTDDTIDILNQDEEETP